MINERKNSLFKAIVEDYIKSAQPVGSLLLANKKGFSVSSATIRNDMAELGKEGLIYQPHTSAGRAPTEVGYRYYVNNFLSPQTLPAAKTSLLAKAAQEQYPNSLKSLAKVAAEMSGEMAFIGFAPNDVYYTGISNLLSKEEFINYAEAILDIGHAVDSFGEVVEKLFDKVNNETKILIGSENPFDYHCSAFITSVQVGKKKNIFGLLGPMRTDYNKNIAILNNIEKTLKNNI